jgi:hypothetical protein
MQGGTHGGEARGKGVLQAPALGSSSGAASWRLGDGGAAQDRCAGERQAAHTQRHTGVSRRTDRAWSAVATHPGRTRPVLLCRPSNPRRVRRARCVPHGSTRSAKGCFTKLISHLKTIRKSPVNISKL